MDSERVNSSFFVCLIYQSDLCIVDTVNETSSLVSAQTFFQPRRQEEILYCCKISKLFYGQVFFLMILHIFRCCSSVLKCLTMDNTVSIVGFVLYANRKTKTDKKLSG